MKKTRIYELAKELNTTSKRLMEKLAEININVKNHMSLLEDNELESLYKHIGIIKHDEGRKSEIDDRKSIPPAAPGEAESKKDVSKDKKRAPRIIRTTEIIIDSQNDIKKVEQPLRNDPKHGRRNDFVRVADTNSGLRSGYVRDTGNYQKAAAKNTTQHKPHNAHPNQDETRGPAVEEIGHQERPASKIEDRQLPGSDVKNKEMTLQQKAAESQKPEAAKQEIEKPQMGNTESKVESKKIDNPEIAAKQDILNNNVTARPAEGEKDTTMPENNNSNRQNEQFANNQNKESTRPQGDRVQTTERQDRPQGDRPQDGRPYGDRPQGDRPQGGRPYGDRPQGDRPQGGRPYGDRPQGDRPQGGRPYGDRPQGDRPQGGRPYGDRPQGDRPQGGRPYGDRPQGDRPQGGRPYGDRPQGDRPQGGRPYGDRPQGDRPQGGRPYGDRPQGDRPQGGRPYGDRPQGDRPQGGRPYGDRPQGDRPQGGRPYGDRPQGGRPYGDRPQGDRPQGGRPYGDRPQGGRPYGDRPQGDRPQGGFRQNKSLDIPKTDMTDAEKEELYSQRNEARREFQVKDVNKDIKREQKREVPKNQPADRSKRFKPQKVLIEKKGVSEVLSEDFILEEFFDTDGVKRSRKTARPKRENEKRFIPHKAVLTNIKIPESITVKDLAEALKKTATEVIKKLMGLGMMVTLNNVLDFDTAVLVADEYGVKAEKDILVTDEDILFEDDADDEDKLKPRSPVVVVMGHVDHGKTSLLDAIRKTNVIESEAGGITQHIGAYTVRVNNRNITFLDTPGHEAFTAMRARGAQVTDIAILVVAADDGVMPQTIEAINHAKAAKVSIIVAINKIDKPGANPERVKQELTEYGLVSEEWGGDVIFVPVSATQKTNIDQLLEMVLLTADMLELKANPDRQAKGTIIEAKLDKSRGPVATALVQRGTLNAGDSVITGMTVGRIRVMTDDKGNKINKAGPSTPVEIVGLSEVPEAGETFYAITDEKTAKHLVEKRKRQLREQQLKTTSIVTLDDLFNQIKEGKVKELNIIIKADVQGSVEAVKQSLEKLSNDEVRVNIIHGAVGAITESDVTLAQVSNAIIIGFNVRPGANVAEAAESAGVDMRLYRIIYKAIEDIQAAMKGMLEPTFKEVVLGHAEIRQIFKVSDIGTIGGSYVTDGKIARNSDVRIVRNGIVVHEGKLASLKRFKDDAKEVLQGFECGLSIEKFNDIKEGDVVEAFAMEEVAR